eukprot:GHVO01067152.1.p1 GENE.GHVO01067152.1~~GHVO01067152.1.p1  ORF type:complete len:126 (+),score=11.24 GHVO01067152.1:75-452(+)
MQGVVARSSGLANVLKATAKTVPSKVEALGAAVLSKPAPFFEKSPEKTHSNYALASQLPPSGFLNPRVTSGIGGEIQSNKLHVFSLRFYRIWWSDGDRIAGQTRRSEMSRGGHSSLLVIGQFCVW